jgi:hypothetical protein
MYLICSEPSAYRISINSCRDQSYVIKSSRQLPMLFFGLWVRQLLITGFFGWCNNLNCCHTIKSFHLETKISFTYCHSSQLEQIINADLFMNLESFRKVTSGSESLIARDQSVATTFFGNYNMLYLRQQFKLNTVFPRIVSAETILF